MAVKRNTELLYDVLTPVGCYIMNGCPNAIPIQVKKILYKDT